MKILTVSQYFPPDSTFGAENYAYNLSLEFLRNGHEVSIFTSAKDDGEERIDSINYNDLKLNRLFNFSKKHPYKSPKVRQSFNKLLKSEKPDVIHFHHLAGLCSSLPEMAAKLNIPIFFTLHDYWNLCSNYHFLKPDNSLCPFKWGDGCADCDFHTNSLLQKNAQREKSSYTRHSMGQFYIQRQKELCQMFNYAEVIYCPSQFLLEVYKKAGIAEEKLRYSPNGMKSQRGQAKPSNKNSFVFIGSLSEHKGIQILTKAFSQLPPKYQLDIYGKPGHNQQGYWENIKENLYPNCNYRGSLKQEGIISTLQNYSALIIPSIWYENAPLVINEAYLAGIPIICSNIGGMAEMVKDGQSGLHFKVGDSEDLASLIIKITTMDDFTIPPIRSIKDDALEKLANYRRI